MPQHRLRAYAGEFRTAGCGSVWYKADTSHLYLILPNRYPTTSPIAVQIPFTTQSSLVRPKNTVIYFRGRLMSWTGGLLQNTAAIATAIAARTDTGETKGVAEPEEKLPTRRGEASKLIPL